MTNDAPFMDTIAAVATPPGEGSVAVLRLSGSESIGIAAKVTKGTAHSLLEVPSHTIHHGFLHHPVTGICIDEVLVSVMRAPRTFTCEDVVEIGCHGGSVLVKMVLEALLAAGARLAEPGEFTKRAFFHGRIDLAQAEALMDLIHARTEKIAQAALAQHRGHFSGAVNELRDSLLTLLAHIAVTIDYPEYDTDQVVAKDALSQLIIMEKTIADLLESAHQGERLQAGIRVVIIGRPNVGKSSLLNALAGTEKAIVTDIAGTTRDLIEVEVTIDGFPFLLVDTAGLRDAVDRVEQMGVERAQRARRQADVVVWVVDGSQPLQEEEQRWLMDMDQQPEFIIVNKIDLPQKIDRSTLRGFLPGESEWISCSVQQQIGLSELKGALVRKGFPDAVTMSDKTTALHLCNLRQSEALRCAQKALGTAAEALRSGMPIDLAEADIRNCWECLGEAVGSTVQEDLLDSIFSRFCLGK